MGIAMRIELKDGRVLDGRLDAFRGTPEQPFTPTDLRTKRTHIVRRSAEKPVVKSAPVKKTPSKPSALLFSQFLEFLRRDTPTEELGCRGDCVSRRELADAINARIKAATLAAPAIAPASLARREPGINVFGGHRPRTQQTCRELERLPARRQN